MESLPSEILLKIFAYLPYWDLKVRLPFVCHRFRTVLGMRSRTGRIDRVLFRDEPKPIPHHTELRNLDNSDAVGNTSLYLPNRVFNLLHMYGGDSLSDIMIAHQHVVEEGSFRTNHKRFIDSPIQNENAVSPALRKIILQVNTYDEVVVDGSHNPNGAISVLDVMKAVVKVLDVSLSPAEIRLGLGMTSEERVHAIMTGRYPTRAKQIHDHVWKGFGRMDFNDGECKMWTWFAIPQRPVGQGYGGMDLQGRLRDMNWQRPGRNDI